MPSSLPRRFGGRNRARLRSERWILRALAACLPAFLEGPPVKLIWSQSSSAVDRPRQVLLLAVVCLFLGGLVGGRADSPRPFRAAGASLFATGGLFFFAGAVGLAFRKKRGTSQKLKLAFPSGPNAQPERLSGLREEEQR